ncbi:MAG: hypothetical protein R3B49_00395 [Phycisphaerales bacterium]
MARANRTNRALLTLNVALLALLGAVTLASSAGAQGASGRLRGEYLVVGGEVDGSTDNVAYVLDTTNQELVAVRWSATRGANGEFEVVGHRDLRADQNARPGR